MTSEQPIARALELVWPADVTLHTALQTEHGSAAERRASARRDGRGDVSVAAAPPAHGHGFHNGWVREHGTAGRLIDLSMTGVSMVFTRPLETETAILVRLAPHDGCHPVDVPARVVRSLELADGQWKVVAQFDQQLCFDQAYVLTQPAPV